VLGKAIRSPPPRPALRRLLDGLEAVLAESGEVDQKVGGVGEPRGEGSASSVHGFQAKRRPGQKASFAGVLACQAWLALKSGGPQRPALVPVGVPAQDLAVLEGDDVAASLVDLDSVASEQRFAGQNHDAISLVDHALDLRVLGLPALGPFAQGGEGYVSAAKDAGVRLLGRHSKRELGVKQIERDRIDPAFVEYSEHAADDFDVLF
jgi:hypothetical protein